MNVQILSEYLDFLEIEKGLSENTLEAYERDLESFFEFCNDIDIEQIQRTQINSYVRNLHEKNIHQQVLCEKLPLCADFSNGLVQMKKLNQIRL